VSKFPASRAFVLSGGASLGAVQVGMLEALFERGIAPDMIIGASAGAINGAFIASREPTVQTARELGEVWRGLNRGTVCAEARGAPESPPGLVQ
jgi:NTE family protein